MRRLLPFVLFFFAATSCFLGDDSSSTATDDRFPDGPFGVRASGDRLYAAAGQAVITPNGQNHPETIYLGGIYPARLATGVHDDLLASVLVLARESEHVVLVSLDFLGFTSSRIREIQQRLAGYGLNPEHILIASTHTHEAPDTMGVFGPNLYTSGVSRTYMNFVQDQIVQAVLDTWQRIEPVTVRASLAKVDDLHSNFPTLTNDFRLPEITVPFVAAARFDNDAGGTVATLVNWHSHPEVMIESTEVSSDFPRWVRQRMQDVLGGTSVYISGAVGGLATPTGVEVPARDENGDVVLNEFGDPEYLLEGTWDKARSLGFEIADRAIDALDAAPAVDPPLDVTVVETLFPVQNPIMMAAFVIGILEYNPEELVTGVPEVCGWFGCSPERIGVVRLGPLALVTSPGETFPETFVGRDEFVFDFGGEWGATTFPAITGLVDYMNAEVPMHMGVCGNEIGYLIPEEDFHPRDHPDYYEEDLFLGYDSETVYREAAIDILTTPEGP